ncbi:HpcH/HpaI aldolase/citrate lyase family protein [Roseibium sediminicola]|uniref:CoA ester lyase n=1 Tax=Roseibium sediminicola TaxID=2933272 RepID=A0ABT0H1A5_9HYPH|nr:CoA ester lyase [Roseibium sp. CAU 1639]MCK7614848.1 CoA ester lyase [Roseibium sp. CAU 1639]
MVGSLQAPLFVPADRPERFAKAAASDADAIILDLEDAVPATEKDSARANLVTDFTDNPVIVRINAVGTAFHDADIEALKRLGVAAVMVPKAEATADIALLWSALDGEVPVIALIESAIGLANARTLASLEGVVRLAFGSIDYCADLGCAHEREVLLPVRTELVLASKLAGIAAPIDGVTANLSDPDQTFSDTVHAKDLGMTGKLCIHPKQVAEVRRAFAPSETEVEWARRVLASGDGAVSIDGAMVDEPVRMRARAILATLPEKTA